MHDAVKAFSSSLRDLSLIGDIEVAQSDCMKPEIWKQGEQILKLLDEVLTKNQQ